MRRLIGPLVAVMLVFNTGLVEARTHPAKPGPASFVFEDTFNRIVPTGQSLGRATSGQDWVTTSSGNVGLYTVSVDGAKANVSMGPDPAGTNQLVWEASLGRNPKTGPFDLLLEWTPTANNPLIAVWLGTTTGVALQMGYAFNWPLGVTNQFTAAWIYDGVNPSPGGVSAPTTFPLGVEMSARLRYAGGQLLLRVWPTASAEPSTWDASFTFSFVPVIDTVELLTSDQHFVPAPTCPGCDPYYKPAGSALAINHLRLSVP